MRRANRSIEVFDISLMAVVTKAMGAFLVLMLIFMQYYKSGPIGQQTTSDIKQTIEATAKEIAEAERKLAQNSSPADIAKLLAEAQRLLEQARQQIAQLQRENDALNAQVARLERENTEMQMQIEDMQRKIDAQKTILSATLVSWDCLDVRLELALMTTNMFVERDHGKIKDKYVLNSGGLGATDTIDQTNVLAKYPGAASEAPGENHRFNTSSFRYPAEGGTYSLVVIKERPEIKQINGSSGRLLTHSKADCTGLLSVQTTEPAKEQMAAYFTQKVSLPKDQYVTALYELKVEGRDVKSQTISDATRQWLDDQIAHAAKAP